MTQTAAQARRFALQNDRREMLRRMVEIRLMEDRVKELFGEGTIRGTTHTCQGQEAVCVGVAAATRPTDTIACTYRGHGHALALGMEVRVVLGEIMGRSTGSMRGLGGSMHLCDPSVGLLPTMAIIGAGIPIGAGAALTAQVLETDDVAVSIFGDGSANIGAFHEGLNLAAIWRLPVVFVCENNLYGEYSRYDLTTPISDIAERAGAYAMPSAIIDGQDVDAVIAGMEEAVERARSGGGPTLVEMKTYRYSGHSRSDPATYRLEGELAEWRARDPIELFARHLQEQGFVGEDDLAAMRAEEATAIESVVDELRDTPEPSAADLLRHVVAG